MTQASVWLRLVILGAALLFYGGVLWEPAWSTVNDGNNLVRVAAFHQQLTEGRLTWRSALDAWQLRESGLCRPCYHWVHWIEYRALGLDCWKHHLWRFLVVLGVCYILFSIATRVTGSLGAGWLTAVLYILFSPNVEFWFALDDPVFYPTVLATVSLWVMVRALATPRERSIQRWMLVLAAVALYVPAYYTKENSLALFGVAAALWVACLSRAGSLLNRHNLALVSVNLAAHICLAAGWFWLRSLLNIAPIASGSYTANYSPTPGVMTATAFKYSDTLWNGFQLLFPIALALFLWRLWLWIRGRRELDDYDGWAFVGLSWFACVIAFMLPWKSPIARYLVTGVPGLSLFVGFCLWRFLSQTSRPTAEIGSPTWPRTVLRWTVLANLALLPVVTLVRN